MKDNLIPISSSSNIVWIAWENHRRTTEISKVIFNLKLYQLVSYRKGLLRYFILVMKTLKILVREHPKLLIVQNPSVILTLLAVSMGRFWAHRVFVDAHNEGLQPFDKKLQFLLPLYRNLQRWADLTIVTNPKLAQFVRANGGNPLVLSDKIPHFQSSTDLHLKGQQNIAFICTFEKDEPYAEVIEAAGLIDTTITIHITGNYHKHGVNLPKNIPANVGFTGFIPENEYINLLSSCDIVMDLTTLENCMVCGAYEALALGKPMILSDSSVSRDYFYKGVIHTANNARSIADSIRTALAEKQRLCMEVAELRAEREMEWTNNLKDLSSLFSV